MAEPTGWIVDRLDALQTRYQRALDRRDMPAWAACFGSTEARYECNSRENFEAELPLATMLDDNPRRIQDRVKAVEQVWTGTFDDYFTRHVVQRLSWSRLAEGRWAMESNFIVTFTTGQDGETRVLASGAYLDEIVLEGEEARFASRRAIFDCSVTPRYLVYPL